MSHITENVLNKIPDITKLYKKFISNRITLKDLYNLLVTIQKVIPLTHRFHQDEHGDLELVKSVDDLILKPLNSIQSALVELESLLFNAIDLDGYESKNVLWIRCSYSKELEDLKNELLINREKAEKQYAKLKTFLAERISSVSIKLDCDKKGYFFRSTKQHSQTISEIPEFIVVGNSAKDVRFQTERLVPISEEYVDLTKQYEDLQEKFVSVLAVECSKYFIRFL